MGIRKLLLSAGVIFLFASCASFREGSAPGVSKFPVSVTSLQEDLSGEDLIGVLESAELAEEAEKSVPEEDKLDFPLALNDKVQFFINYFTGPGRRTFEKWLRRSTRYIPLMKEILKKEGLPEDLVYLALIESGFNPHAYSRARAAGPWQFIKSTARRYGLRVDFWVDERRDPVKSTIAAARYLKDLYDMFGHWYLAAAGYNAGERKILRAIERTGNHDFWAIAESKYLKRETKEYVPKMLAAAIIAKNPEAFGFHIDPLPPFEFDVVEVKGVVDIAVVARACGITTREIRELNPALRRWFTPPDVKSYPLRVPKGKGEECAEKLKKIPRKNWVRFKKHRLRRGDTLWELALSYGTTVREIMRLNGIRNVRRLRPGKVILLPVRPGTKPRKIYWGRGRRLYRITKLDGKKPIFYRVKPGDSLWDISMKFGVSIRQLKKWNRIPRRNLIRPGDILVIFTAKRQT